jgi:hypothetical protein
MQLASRHGRQLAVDSSCSFCLGRNLDFQICGGQREDAVAQFQKYVGKNWERVAAFHYPADRLKRSEQKISLYLYLTHWLFFLITTNKLAQDLWITPDRPVQ